MAALMACHTAARADNYVITALNTPQIIINGTAYHKGDMIPDTKNVAWSSKSQSMEAKNVATGRVYRFSKKLFDSKGVLTIADYFATTKRASTRGEGSAPLFTKSPTGDKFPEKRIALVMGNSDYSYLSYLRNAQKDASDVADRLLDLGFDVVEAYECSSSDMRTALNNFSAKAKDYDVAMFYFAGHGLQEENQNYLIPVDCPLEYVSQLRDCLNADDVVQRLDASGADARLIFLDACRNTKKSWSRDATDGLARMEGSVGSVIVFSTQSGKVALDGEGDNSPFAYSLMKNIVEPEVGFSNVMTNVVRDTYNMTDKKQFPLTVGTLISDFKFNAPGARVEGPKGEAPRVTESAPAAGNSGNNGGGNGGTKLGGNGSNGGGNSQPASTPRSEEPTVTQPRVTSDAPEIEAYVESCRMSGGFLIVDLYIINKSNKDRELMILEADGDNKTVVYDADGNRYFASERDLKVISSGETMGNAFYINTPKNIPVKVQLRVPEAAETEKIARIDIALRGLPNGRPYGNGMIKIFDIPVGFKASKPSVEVPMSSSLNVPDMTLKVSEAKRVGEYVDFTLTITNETGKDYSPVILDRDPGKSDTEYVDGSGMRHNEKDMEFKCGDSTGVGYLRFTLPEGLPTAIKVRLKGVPKSDTVIPRINIALRGISDEMYGSGKIAISSLPIK